MDIDTFNRLKEKRIKLLSNFHNNKFILKSLNDIDTLNQIKAINFVENLIKDNVDINAINVNDFESCPQPKVYIYCNTYKRFSEYDKQNAIKLYQAIKKIKG